jgi:hypothetical protein
MFERTRAIATRIQPGLIEIFRDLSKLLQRYYFALSYDSFLAHHFQLIIRSSLPRFLENPMNGKQCGLYGWSGRLEIENPLVPLPEF